MLAERRRSECCQRWITRALSLQYAASDPGTTAARTFSTYGCTKSEVALVFSLQRGQESARPDLTAAGSDPWAFLSLLTRAR